jgi:uncharacterized membrane protein
MSKLFEQARSARLGAAISTVLIIFGIRRWLMDSHLPKVTSRCTRMLIMSMNASSMRRHLPAILLFTVLFALLALAVAFMFTTWQQSHGQMTIHGWIALGLGVFFSVVVGCGLMALMFFSSRRGYDERASEISIRREDP